MFVKGIIMIDLFHTTFIITIDISASHSLRYMRSVLPNDYFEQKTFRFILFSIDKIE